MESDVLVASGVMPQSFMDTIIVPYSGRQRVIFTAIENEDYESVKKKVAEELQKQGKVVTSEYLEEGILALKQYYAICFLDDNPHAISDELDPFWHAHILNTVQYHQFCEKLGIGYMHHAPLDHGDKEQVEGVRLLYVHTQNVFKKCYNWVSPIFNPFEIEDNRLVCKHYSQNSFTHEGDKFFRREAVLMEHDELARYALAQ